MRNIQKAKKHKNAVKLATLHIEYILTNILNTINSEIFPYSLFRK